MCANHAMLPRSLQIGLCHNPADPAHSRGGFADVWKGEHHGLEVAAKVLRVYSNSDLLVITRVSHQGTLHLHIFFDVLAMARAEVLQGVRDMEDSQSSKRVATTRSQHGRGSVHNGVGVDDEWKHQPVCKGKRGSEPV